MTHSHTQRVRSGVIAASQRHEGIDMTKDENVFLRILILQACGLR